MPHQAPVWRSVIRRLLLPLLALLVLASLFSLRAPWAGGADQNTRGAAGIGPSRANTPVSRDDVVIAADHAVYQFGAIITGTVSNGLSQSIFTEDEQTDCSIALLEQWDGATWQPRRGCALRRLALAVVIDAGASASVSIDPRSPHLSMSLDAPPIAIGPGRYRLTFTYRLSRESAPESDATVSSACFEVAP